MTRRYFCSAVSSILSIVALISLSGIGSQGETGSVLHSFDPIPHGANPNSRLIADTAGNLYGTTYSGGGYGLVFKLTRANGTWTQTVLHKFAGPEQGLPEGAYPLGPLVFDSSGNLYGTTWTGGAYGCGGPWGCGTVFKLTPTASGPWRESVLFDFAGLPSDGSSPNGSLVFDQAGNLYGTTSEGGSGSCVLVEVNVGCGTVFELSPASGGRWTERIIYNFQDGSDGSTPMAGLVMDQAGNLYGTTEFGGMGDCNYGDPPFGCGTVFKLAPGSNGTWTESVLYEFTGGSDGGVPSAGLIFDAAGNLYGTTTFDTVFELKSSGGGWAESTLYTFTGGADGNGPNDLAIDDANNLYGTAASGGSKNCFLGCGTVFELSPNSGGGWKESTIYSFTGGSDGSGPSGGPYRDTAGILYVPASSGDGSCYPADNGSPNGCGAIFKLMPSTGGTWKGDVVYHFRLLGDGAYPSSGLIPDGAGALYGVTSGGGMNVCPYFGQYFGCGTVFKLARSSEGNWKTSVIHSFKSTGGGFSPSGDLAFDETGSLYGVAAGSTRCTLGYCGIVYKLKRSPDGTWNESVIYSFMGGANDGGMPDGGVVFDPAGNLYGTTSDGGSSQACEDYGCGTIFKLSPRANGGWKETILYFFTGGSDGLEPYNVVRNNEGNLFGVSSGGASGGYGVVFKLSHGSVGWNLTVLYTFAGGLDGTNPSGRLIFDKEGNLYGTTQQGGLYDGGVVFKLSPAAGDVWNETVLYNFIGVNGDGAFPFGGLTFDDSGNLYGTTSAGGGNGGACGGLGCGTVFELMPRLDGKSKEKVLRRFSGGTDGGDPSTPVILDSIGNLYGTTMGGGSGAQGTVFEVKP